MITEDERTTLSLFRQNCDEFHSCRFLKQLQEQPDTIRLCEESEDSGVPSYDRDDFRSFVTSLRKIDAERERSNIFRVMKIVGRHVTKKADRMALKVARRRLVALRDRPPLTLVRVKPSGEHVVFTPRKIRDVMFNGEIFHSAPELQEDLAMIGDARPYALWFFLQYASYAVMVAMWLCDVIKRYGLLEPAVQKPS